MVQLMPSWILKSRYFQGRQPRRCSLKASQPVCLERIILTWWRLRAPPWVVSWSPNVAALLVEQRCKQRAAAEPQEDSRRGEAELGRKGREEEEEEEEEEELPEITPSPSRSPSLPLPPRPLLQQQVPPAAIATARAAAAVAGEAAAAAAPGEVTPGAGTSSGTEFCSGPVSSSNREALGELHWAATGVGPGGGELQKLRAELPGAKWQGANWHRQYPPRRLCRKEGQESDRGQLSKVEGHLRLQLTSEDC
eukprot:jgi/Mesen1/905/ME000116S00056